MENITEDCGTDMKDDDYKAFLKWWTDQGCSENDPLFVHAKAAWAAAIAYEQNKTMRTYRWDGVLR